MISSVASRPAANPTAVNSRAQGASTRTNDMPFSLVAEAQAESAKAEQAKAAAEARNADGIKHLAQQGLTMSYGSYTSVYKDGLAHSVDSDGDQSISKSELASQVVRGGGTGSAVAGLYAAMDMNSDGNVSVDEFKNSIPDPYSLPGFKEQLNQLIAKGHADPGSVGALFRQYAESMDAATVLGKLGNSISTTA
jgi:hypothetical protein